MSGVKGTIWEAAPHTIAKHEILKGYLGAWFPIMGSISDRIVYMDGFAGPGEYKNDKRGSPLIALECAQHHWKPTWREIVFLFFERNRARHHNLKILVESQDWDNAFRIKVENKAFAQGVAPILDNLESQGFQLAPTFAFIDPFGWAGVPFKIISRILAYERCEVLLTFMFEEIGRFIRKKEQWVRFTTYFGNDDWKSCMNLSRAAQEQCLIESYVGNLKIVAGAEFVRTFRMTNPRRRTDYYLIYATNHSTGLDRMKQSMWKLAPTGDYQFSDSEAYTRQTTFIQPDFALGRDQILKRFSGKTVSIEEVEKFVKEKTDFPSTQYRTPILKELMEESKPPLIKVHGRKRQRPGEYPKGCRITFDDKME